MSFLTGLFSRSDKKPTDYLIVCQTWLIVNHMNFMIEYANLRPVTSELFYCINIYAKHVFCILYEYISFMSIKVVITGHLTRKIEKLILENKIYLDFWCPCYIWFSTWKIIFSILSPTATMFSHVKIIEHFHHYNELMNQFYISKLSNLWFFMTRM